MQGVLFEDLENAVNSELFATGVSCKKEIVTHKEITHVDLEQIAYECRGCGKESSYRIEHNFKVPRGWVDIKEKGVYCSACKNKRSK